jgi:hypothetical protein
MDHCVYLKLDYCLQLFDWAAGLMCFKRFAILKKENSLELMEAFCEENEANSQKFCFKKRVCGLICSFNRKKTFHGVESSFKL